MYVCTCADTCKLLTNLKQLENNFLGINVCFMHVQKLADHQQIRYLYLVLQAIEISCCLLHVCVCERVEVTEPQ